jgi:pimeloyl-ACP methyl ester carboxylesterase
MIALGLQAGMRYPDPESDGRAQVIKNHRLIKVPNAGHWAHHDQLETFLEETKKFLA